MTYRNNFPEHELEFQLVLTADQIERLYSGSAQSVVCRCTTGQVIRFPLKVLRPFVTRTGVNGRFKIIFDDNYKFKTLKQL